MSYDDLCSSYGTVEICMLKPDVDLKDGARKQWNVQEARGEWKKGVNAGGCWNYLNSYYTNPQIRFEIPVSSN